MSDATRGTVKALEEYRARLTQSEDRWEEHVGQMTRFMDRTDERFLKIDAHLEKQDANARALATLVQEMTNRFRAMEDKTEHHEVHSLVSHEDEEGFYPRRREPAPRPRRPMSGPGNGHHIKMEVPRFNGTSPRSWLYNVERYFRFYDIEEDQKAFIASVYLDGNASSWFQSIDTNDHIFTWEEFKDLLLQRFGPSPYRDLRGELAKMHQVTTVQQFFNDFEELSNQIPGIPESARQSYFESGLKQEIRGEVRALQPTSLVKAFQLAKLMEDRLANVHPPPPPILPHQPPTQPPLLLAPPQRPPLLLPSPTDTQLPIRRLTPAQMVERRSKGLCFNCNDRFHPGHICQAKLFLLVAPNEDYDEPGNVNTDRDSDPIDYG